MVQRGYGFKRKQDAVTLKQVAQERRDRNNVNSLQQGQGLRITGVKAYIAVPTENIRAAGLKIEDNEPVMVQGEGEVKLCEFVKNSVGRFEVKIFKNESGNTVTRTAVNGLNYMINADEDTGETTCKQRYLHCIETSINGANRLLIIQEVLLECNPQCTRIPGVDLTALDLHNPENVDHVLGVKDGCLVKVALVDCDDLE